MQCDAVLKKGDSNGTGLTVSVVTGEGDFDSTGLIVLVVMVKKSWRRGIVMVQD